MMNLNNIPLITKWKKTNNVPISIIHEQNFINDFTSNIVMKFWKISETVVWIHLNLFVSSGGIFPLHAVLSWYHHTHTHTHNLSSIGRLPRPHLFYCPVSTAKLWPLTLMRVKEILCMSLIRCFFSYTLWTVKWVLMVLYVHCTLLC